MALRSARTAFTASGEAALHSTHESPLKGVAYGIHPSNWCMSEFPLRTSSKRCAEQRDAPTQEKMHEGGMSVCGGAWLKLAVQASRQLFDPLLSIKNWGPMRTLLSSAILLLFCALNRALLFKCKEPAESTIEGNRTCARRWFWSS